MAKLYVRYERKNKQRREIDVEEGELVMVVHGDNRYTNVTLGIFSEIINKAPDDIESLPKGQFYLRRSLLLGKPRGLGGMKIPIIEIRKYKNTPYDQFDKNLFEFHAGKEEIAKRLKEMEGYEMHADWVEKLQKPY